MIPIGSDWYSGLSKFEKLCWSIISLAAFCVLFYEWVLIVQDYAQNPIRSTVHYKEPKSMRFPSLLFCQRQFYLNESKIGGLGDGQLNQNLAKYMRIVTNPTGTDAAAGSSNVAFNSEQDQNKAKADYLSYVGKLENNPWAAFEQFMLDCNGMISKCSLGGENYSAPYCCQQWTVNRLTPIGPCLAVQPPDQHLPSSSGAFQIDFDLSPNAYGLISNFGGFDLYIGDAVGRPMSVALTLLDEDSYTVQLAASTYRNGVSGQCNSSWKPIFRQFDLGAMDESMRCTATAVRKLCKCDPVYKVQLDAVLYGDRSKSKQGIDDGTEYRVPQGSYQFCDLSTILKCALPLLNSTRDPANFTGIAERLLGHVPCDTKPPCLDNRYHFAVTEFREMTPSSGNYRSHLRLYYESFLSTEIDQRSAYNFHDIIINMGGTLVFWFVAVHILFYMVSAFKYCLQCGGKTQHGQANGMDRNKVTDIEVGLAPNRPNKPRKSMAPVERAVEPSFSNKINQ